VLLAESNVAWFLFVAAVALLSVFLLRRSHRYFSRQKRDGGSAIVRTPRPQPEGPPRPADAPPEMLRWQVEMHETARELSGQLDSKMAALQALVAEADRAAARLEAALAETPADQDHPPAASADFPETRQQICTLADYGYPPAEIAARAGLPVGEVERVLGLREE